MPGLPVHGCMGPFFSKDKADYIFQQVIALLIHNGIRKPNSVLPGDKLNEHYERELDNIKKAIDDIVFNDDCAKF